MHSFGLKRSGQKYPSNSRSRNIIERAEETAATLPGLLLNAKRVAQAVEHGVHERRRAGQGDSFWQFRQYQQGDASSRIDWRQTAKREHAYIRENEWVAAQSVWLWLDRSSSMQYHSDKALPYKSDRAALLALALSILLIRGGEKIALSGSGIVPITGIGAIERFAQELSIPNDEKSNLPLPKPLPRYARAVLISDFLSPPNKVSDALTKLSGNGIQGHLLQIFDPAEENLPFSGRVLFNGLEGEGSALISRVETARTEYMSLMTNHRETIRKIAHSLGWTSSTHSTDQPPSTVLLTLYQLIADSLGR